MTDRAARERGPLGAVKKGVRILGETPGTMGMMHRESPEACDCGGYRIGSGPEVQNGQGPGGVSGVVGGADDGRTKKPLEKMT